MIHTKNVQTQTLVQVGKEKISFVFNPKYQRRSLFNWKGFIPLVSNSMKSPFSSSDRTRRWQSIPIILQDMCQLMYPLFFRTSTGGLCSTIEHFSIFFTFLFFFFFFKKQVVVFTRSFTRSSARGPVEDEQVLQASRRATLICRFSRSSLQIHTFRTCPSGTPSFSRIYK